MNPVSRAEAAIDIKRSTLVEVVSTHDKAYNSWKDATNA